MSPPPSRPATASCCVDTRGHSSWHQGRATGAVHIPRAEIAARAAAEIPLDTPVVVYCWGPACNGATRSAIEFLKLGYSVREMIGGFEYWAREGAGRRRRPWRRSTSRRTA